MISASCCCGAIQFELLAAPSMMATCHCSRCRKVGAATFVFVERKSLRWIAGQEYVARYEPEEGFKYARCFCSKCGTALGEIESTDDSFPVSAHCLDDDPGIRNRFHEFVSSKPEWLPICDDAKQFDEHPFKS
jgi:hypothetical protein